MCAAANVSERVYFFVVCRRELRAGEAWFVKQEVRELGSSDELTGEIFTRANPIITLLYSPFSELHMIPLKKRPETILFDFDGTLANTFSSAIKIFNKLSTHYHYKKIKEAEVEQLRNLPARDVMRLLNISLFRLPFLVRRVRKELAHTSPKLVPGWRETLKELKKKGYLLGIVTSNSEEHVEKFLTQNKLHLFDFVCASARAFGKGRVIRKLLHQKKLSPAHTVYVADETRDIDATKKSSIKSVAVTWGFNSKQALAKLEPEAIIHKPKELLGVLDKLN